MRNKLIAIVLAVAALAAARAWLEREALRFLDEEAHNREH